MSYIISIIGLILIIANIYFGSVHRYIYNKELYKSTWRISLKALNIAISNSRKDKIDTEKLIKVRRLYYFYLMLFYAECILIIITIFKNAKI